jgi:NAD(P)-dependent dehydrogenase (short-subunit alcohol dehydrogenase family)
MEKTWFITGASSGFGRELAQAAMDKGDKVVATFRKSAQAESFTKAAGDKGIGVEMDVTNTDQVLVGLQTAIEKFGRIDVLVNNAGYGTVGAIEEFSMEEIRAQMETNFFGAIYLTKEVLPIMRRQDSGHIIQISSQAGFKAGAGFGLYNASKFALEGFSEALALEVQPFNIRVVIVEPGPFRTQFAGTSIKAAKNRIEAYKESPVARTYEYIKNVNGVQEGDPVKGARVIVHYVHNNNPHLRLPLGKTPLQSLRAKLAHVEEDLKANEALALSAVYLD